MKTNIVIIIALMLVVNIGTAQKKNPVDDRPKELEEMEFFIGKWRDKEEGTDKDSRTYRFGVEMKWFDRKKTIIKVHVYGAYDDGKNQTYFEGFKHWDGIQKKMI